MTAVAAHHIVALKHFASTAALFDNANTHALVILLDLGCRPSGPNVDIGKIRHPIPQHLLGEILGQPLVALKVIGIDEFAHARRSPVLAHQVAVGRYPAHGEPARQQPRGAHLVRHPPGVQVLHRALREALPLRDAMRLGATLDHRAGDAALR